MSQREFTQPQRAVLEDPDAVEPWIALLRLFERHQRPLPREIQELVNPQRLLHLWSQNPHARILEQIFPLAFGLEIIRCHEEPPGRYWTQVERLGQARDHWYDRITGLPVEVMRLQDQSPMVLIPAGAIPLGEGSGRRIGFVGTFWMDRYPVTRQRFRAFLEDHSEKPWAPNSLRAFQLTSGSLPPQHPSFPMAPVSLPQVQAYALWVQAEIPSQDEWEKAARGHEGATLPWGNGTSTTRRANFDPYLPSRRFPRTPRDPRRVGDYMKSVGSFPTGRSPFGVEETVGGVFELCLENGRAPMLKGSSWISRLDELHLAREIWFHTQKLSEDESRGITPDQMPIGFRLLRRIPTTGKL